ncbi:MAG: hypothetical protein VXW38_07750 [Bacteroidota bacterium]|nr:hypothetical protein [Bacteroidota bacterium]
MAKKLAESIDLDEDTKASFLEISEKYDNKAKELMQGDRKSGFEKMKALEEEKRKSSRPFLPKNNLKNTKPPLRK